MSSRRALDLNLVDRDAFFDCYERYVNRERRGRKAPTGGDCYNKYDSMIANIVPCGPIVFRKAFDCTVIRRIRAVFTGPLLCRVVPYCTIVYPSICDTQVGYITCANDRLRPPSWRE